MRRRLIKASDSVTPVVDTRPEVLNVSWVGDSLVVVERDADLSIRVRTERAPSATFIKLADAPSDFMRALSVDRRVFRAGIDGDYIRIQWRDRREGRQLTDRLGAKMATYEGDVNPVRRWMTDHAPRLGKHRIGYLDIETDSRVPFSRKEDMRVLCWTLVTEDGKRSVGVLEEDTDSAERQLLSALFAKLQSVDLVAAWNGDRFDFPVIKERASRCRLSVTHERWLWLDQMVVFQRMNMMAAESGEEKQSFALGAIATALLGEGKDDFDASKTWEAWAAGGDERRRMVRYCVKDTDLLRRIEEKTGYIGLLQTLAETCNVFPDTRGANPTIQAEGFLLSLGAARGYRFPTAVRSAETEQYRGAYVMQPKASGILKHVHVADFASLYPSIIVTWNMSPETLTTATGANTAHAPITDCLFLTDHEGILPHAVKEVMRLRKQWTKLKDSFPPGTDEWQNANRKATAYKIAANSLYGVVGSPMSRFFSKDVAESVTQAGAWLIKLTIAEAEARGMFAVYGDTDSVFVTNSTRQAFGRFTEWCNEKLYPVELPKLGCKENLIKLAYEKEFERLIFTSAKKYCGRFVHYKGKDATQDSKPEVKGLEYKRGDSVRLTRQLQAEVVDLLVGMVNGGHEDPETFVEVISRWCHRILLEPLEAADVVISKRLSRPLNEYAVKLKKDGTPSKQLPHVEIAKLLAAKGQDMGEGAKVTYFVFDASGPETIYASAENWTGTFDRHDLWESQVFPPTQRLLEAAFPTYDWRQFGKTRPKKTPVSRAKKPKA